MFKSYKKNCIFGDDMKWWVSFKKRLLKNKEAKTSQNVTKAGSSVDANLNNPFKNISNVEFQSATVYDWLKSIEALQVLVYLTRRELEPTVLTSFDWNALSATTYLNHIERLIIKVREYYLAYKHYEEKGFDKLGVAESHELKQYKLACEQSYHTLLNLTQAIKKVLAKESHEDLSHHLHALELEISGLGSTLRLLTQTLYRQEVKNDHEDYKKYNTTYIAPLLTSKRESPVYIDFTSPNSQQITLICDQLRSEITPIPSLENKKLLLSALEVYEMLLKCYVVARKTVINQSLENFKNGIVILIDEMNKTSLEPLRVFAQLDCLFYNIEAISFSTNRESRFSQNMFEKSRLAKRLLRKACNECELGISYLKEHTLYRDVLEKPKGKKN